MPEMTPSQTEMTEDEKLSKTELEKKEFEEKRKHLRVDIPERPIQLTIYFKVDNTVIAAHCEAVNFSLGGMLIRTNESLPLRVNMKAQYKNKGILVEGIRQQGNMYGIQYHYGDMNTLYEFYLELIHDVIFDGHISYLFQLKKK